MSYSAEVLTDAPLAYYRLDTIGAATDGQTVPDSSGNGLDGELSFGNAGGLFGNPAGTYQCWGYGSAIETDPSSYAFRMKLEGSLAYDHSYITVPNDASLQLTDDVAVEAWFKVGTLEEYGVAASPYPVARKQGSYGLIYNYQPTAGTGRSIVRFGFFVKLSDNTNYFVYAPGFVPIEGNWYYLVGVRSGTGLAIYINLELGGLEAIPALGLNAAASPFYIGNEGGVSYGSGYVDEVAVYETLSPTRRQAHYDAARNTLDITLIANALTQAYINSTVEPDPTVFGFRHNWDSRLVERYSFYTGLGESADKSQDRNANRIAPRREVDYTVLIKNSLERARFHAQAWYALDKRWWVPLRGKEQITVSLVIGDTAIPCSTDYKDYEEGGYARLTQIDYESDAIISKQEIVEIDTVDPAGLILTAGTVNAYDANYSFVEPVRRAYLTKGVTTRGQTAGVEEVPVTAQLLPEDDPQTPRSITPWTPTLTFFGYEVFDPAVWPHNDYTETADTDLSSNAVDVDNDTGVTSKEGTAPAPDSAFTYRMILEGEDAVSMFKGWMYYHEGGLLPVWVPTFKEDVLPVSLVGVTLTAQFTDYANTYNGADARKYLVFIYEDWSMEIREITAQETSVGGEDVLTLNSTVSLTDLKLISFLKFCYLPDVFEIAWDSSGVALTSFNFVEALHTPTTTYLPPSPVPFT